MKSKRPKHDNDKRLGKIITKSGLSQKEVSYLLEYKEAQLSAYINHSFPQWISNILDGNEDVSLEAFETKKAKAQRDIIYYDKMIKRVKNITKLRDDDF